MAVDLSTLNGPIMTQVIDLHATGGNAVQVTFPTWARSVRITLWQSGGTASTGTVGLAGTDGGAAGAENVNITTTGIVLPLLAPEQATKPGGTVLFISGDNNADDAHLVISEAPSSLGV